MFESTGIHSEVHFMLNMLVSFCLHFHLVPLRDRADMFKCHRQVLVVSKLSMYFKQTSHQLSDM